MSIVAVAVIVPPLIVATVPLQREFSRVRSLLKRGEPVAPETFVELQRRARVHYTVTLGLSVVAGGAVFVIGMGSLAAALYIIPAGLLATFIGASLLPSMLVGQLRGTKVSK